MDMIDQYTIKPTNNCLLIHNPRTAGNSIRAVTGCWSRHKLAKWLRKELDNWDDLWTFSIVRNPWDQAVSWWSIKTQKKTFDMPFRDWVINNDNPWPHWERRGLDPINQWNYISEDSKIIVSYVGRFENLENEWKLISGKMGFSGSTLPIKAPSKHRDYRNYYDNETVEIIRGRNSEFLANFSYEF